jgi:RNA polymerase sigma-70 factor (ECF subfamily)
MAPSGGWLRKKHTPFQWEPFGIRDKVRQSVYEACCVMFAMIPAPDKGDRTVTSVVEAFRPAIIAYFRRRLHNPADAEDAAQEVFANLCRRAELDRIDDIERYVFQAAANHLRDRFRRAKARPLVEADGFSDRQNLLVDPITPERELLGREAYAATVAALQELPERPRMIFILNRFEEMSGRDIASLLGVSQRLVEKDISRVLTHLRERLS